MSEQSGNPETSSIPLPLIPATSASKTSEGMALTFRPTPALPNMGTSESAHKARDDARSAARGRAPSGFADHLRVELAGLVAYEMEVTVQCGVMIAAGISQTQICHALGIDTAE